MSCNGGVITLLCDDEIVVDSGFVSIRSSSLFCVNKLNCTNVMRLKHNHIPITTLTICWRCAVERSHTFIKLFFLVLGSTLRESSCGDVILADDRVYGKYDDLS